MLDSVRTRLTLWYAGVLALSLVAFGVVTYFAASRAFHARQDDDLSSTGQMVASAYLQEAEESNSAEQASEEILKQTIYPNRYVEFLSDDGRVYATSSNLGGRELAVNTETLKEARERGFSYGVQKNLIGDSDDDGLRVVVVPLSRAGGKHRGFVMVAESLGVVAGELEHVRNDFLLGVPVILLLATAGGYFLARKSLAPITLMNQQTRRISVEDLTARLDVANPRDELGSLGLTINDLLSRLNSAFDEQQRFIADASHELRTPVAILRGETEIALEKDRTVSEYQSSLKLIGEEAERLSRIVTDIFALAGAIPKGPSLDMEKLYLNDIVAECVRAAQILAAPKGLSLNHGDLREVVIEGDEELIKQMLLNLLDNAVKYTPAGGQVVVNCEKREDVAVLSVRDTGIGIPIADQQHIFDRFYRVDKARSRKLGGAGLGLSIAQWVAQVHEGEIGVESKGGEGSTFSVKLPLNSTTSKETNSSSAY